MYLVKGANFVFLARRYRCSEILYTSLQRVSTLFPILCLMTLNLGAIAKCPEEPEPKRKGDGSYARLLSD